MKTYEKIPTRLKATQFFKDNQPWPYGVREITEYAPHPYHSPPYRYRVLSTISGDYILMDGDYIIFAERDGQLYPTTVWSRYRFEQEYREVTTEKEQ